MPKIITNHGKEWEAKSEELGISAYGATAAEAQNKLKKLIDAVEHINESFFADILVVPKDRLE